MVVAKRNMCAFNRSFNVACIRLFLLWLFLLLFAEYFLYELCISCRALFIISSSSSLIIIPRVKTVQCYEPVSRHLPWPVNINVGSGWTFVFIDDQSAEGQIVIHSRATSSEVQLRCSIDAYMLWECFYHCSHAKLRICAWAKRKSISAC